MLLHFLHDLGQLIGASLLRELLFKILDPLLKSARATDVENQVLVDLHDGHTVPHVLGLLTLQLTVQGVHRLFQELHLHFVLFLDFTVFHNDLLMMIFDKVLQLGEYCNLQLLVVINALGNKVDSILESSYVVFILADVCVGEADRSLHVLLLEAQIFNQESKVRVHRVKMTQLLVSVERLQLQLFSLYFLRGNLLL